MQRDHRRAGRHRHRAVGRVHPDGLLLGGSVGIIYRQFSVTIVSAMVLSVLVALMLTPALVRHHSEEAEAHGAKARRVLSAGSTAISIAPRPMKSYRVASAA
jgi:multidrug efflux pump subunit AcrB